LNSIPGTFERPQMIGAGSSANAQSTFGESQSGLIFSVLEFLIPK